VSTSDLRGDDESVKAVGARWEATLRRWSKAAAGMTSEADAQSANTLFDAQRVDVRRLRDHEAGRVFIERLMDDADAGVRLGAAAEVLQWRPDAARRALLAVAADESAPVEHRFSAEMTVREFDAGRLSFDY
jgi:hypothetical protein